jgi:XTP/dITP diphosphohydrolase
MRLLLASRSPGKLRELQPLLRVAGFEGVDLASAGIAETPFEDAIEAHETFEANALAKARHFHALSGMPTLADDSGLCVDALGGRPGVRSKRWAATPGLSGVALDAANNRALLAALAEVGDRGASYVCAAAYVDGDGELVRRGETRGRVLRAPAGSGGFGYDPYFWSLELGRAFAEVSLEEKGTVSHRGRAVSSILAALRDRR